MSRYEIWTYRKLWIIYRIHRKTKEKSLTSIHLSRHDAIFHLRNLRGGAWDRKEDFKLVIERCIKQVKHIIKI